MAEHNDTGKAAEEMAATWLTEQGYEILHRNWRYSRYEIDIIATKGKFLHFVEVKARKASRYGRPEDHVTRKKFKKLQKAVHQYLYLNPGNPWIRYDILAITLHRDDDPEYFLIEDVFL